MQRTSFYCLLLKQLKLQTLCFIHRKLLTEEVERVRDFVLNMFNCRLDDLPTETLSLPHYIYPKMEWKKQYHQCAMAVAGGSESKGCVDKLKGFCPKSAHQCIVNKCDILIDMVKENATNNQLKAVKGQNNTMVKAFKEHRNCLTTLAKKIDLCKPILQYRCESSKVHAAKILRMRLEVVEAILEADPRIYVIHSLRDPRGTMLSRKNVNLLSRNLYRNMIKESKVLCDQMLEDVAKRKQLEKRFPGRFLEITYEDMVQNTTGVLYRMAKHVGVHIPEKLQEELLKLFSSDKIKIEHPEGVERRNATMTANAWRTKLDSTTIQAIDSNCAELYKYAGYQRV